MPDKTTSEPQTQPLEVLPVREEKTLFTWTAPERAFKTRDKEFWVTAIAILVLVSIILFFVKEFFLILALMALIFLYYVLSTVPPENVQHKLTTKGVYVGSTHRYDWDFLKRYWFKSQFDQTLLSIEARAGFPSVIALIVPTKDQEEIQKVMNKHLPYEESPPGFVDKLTAWTIKRLPLEDKTPPSKEEEKK
jgi:hypothetical protein